MHQNFFPFLLSILLLLVVMIAYSVTVEVIEDGTPEKEDLAKALALSKRFFWRTMIEKWSCYEMTVKPNEIGVTDQVKLMHFCDSWKVKALATDAFLKSWEKHEGPSSSSSSANIPKDQIKVEKPLFRVADGRELQLSSAMEAIKAAYRVLFGWRAAEGFNTKFDFVNQSDFLHINHAQKIWPKESKLNQSEFEEEIENGKKCQYLDEYYKKNTNLRKPLVHLLDVINKENEKQKEKQKKQKGTFNEKLIDKPNEIKSNGTRFLEYWDSVLELGLDMEMICKEVKNYENVHKDDPNAYKQFLDEILWAVGTNKTILISIIRPRMINSKEMIKERYVGKTFYIYKHLVRDPMLNKNLDLVLKPLPDPCEEAKLKVKKIEATLSSEWSFAK